MKIEVTGGLELSDEMPDDYVKLDKDQVCIRTVGTFEVVKIELLIKSLKAMLERE